ncbi:MAG: divalent metal cation transporter, partial [Verrucomicrobia bacterium]|nr:divalent metal cation transporter [Verrucomicrobiota bacterium]
QYLRVQRFDLLFGIGANVVLNLAVWTLGAELLFPDKPIKNLDDLPQLLTGVIGNGGRLLFYAGIFAAVYTSIVGHAAGLGHLGSHAWLRARGGAPSAGADLRQHAVYRAIAVWCLVSPLVWTLPGMPDFVTLTLIGNSGQVVLLPLLAGGIWWITASPRYIGSAHRTRWWENIVMALLLLLAIKGAYHSAHAIVQYLRNS